MNDEDPDIDPKFAARLREALSVQEAAQFLGYAPAFVRLAVDCGCPTFDGKIVPANLNDWLIANIVLIRRTAGLSPLPPLPLHSEKRANAQVMHLLKTITDYHGTRTSDPVLKQVYAENSRWLEKQ